MAVEGLDNFIDFFKDYSDSFVIIGGLAASEWLSDGNFAARLTKDIDMVVLAEAKERKFFPRFWEYIRKAGYSKKRRADGKKLGFRFVEPNAVYPAMIELLARPELVDIPDDVERTIVPLDPGDGLSSLSAILLDEPYYRLIIDNVFHLAYLLGGHFTPELNPVVAEDLNVFLRMFPPESPEWNGIHASLAEMDADFLTAEKSMNQSNVFLE